MTPETSPVDEVIISLAVEPVGRLAGPELSRVLGRWWDTHREIQTQPSYRITPEFPVPPNTTALLPFFLQTSATCRYWFISDDESEIVQIQPDYIALNWRRRNGVTYPGHQQLKTRFLDLLATIAKNADTQIRPTAAELTYVNILDASAAEAGDLAILPRGGGDLNVNTIAVYRDLTHDDQFVGRAHAQLNRGYDADKQLSTYYLNLTSRSAIFDEPTGNQSPLDAAMGFIALAHDQLLDIFNTLLTPEARTKWGLV